MRLLIHLLELEGDNGDKRKAGQYQERTHEKDHLCDWKEFSMLARRLAVDDNLVPTSSADGLLEQAMKQRRDVALAVSRTRTAARRRRSVTPN